MITFIYAVLVFLVLRFSVTLFNFLSNPKLGHCGRQFTDLVSIVIDGNRKQAGELLISLKKQDYQHVEVIFKDEIEDLALIQEASGKYLLFLNANSVIEKGLLNSLIYRLKVFDLDVLSLIGTRKITGLKSWTTQPLNDILLLSLFPLRFIKNRQHAQLLLNEACLFYSSEGYRRFYTAKAEERREPRWKTETLLANRLWYTNEEVDQDKLMKTLGRSIPVVLIYLALVMAGPVLMFLQYGSAFFSLPLGLIFLTRVMISFLTVQNPMRNVLMHPLQMLALTILLLKGMWIKLFTSVQHKG